MKINLNKLVMLFHELNGRKENGEIVLRGFLLQKMSAKTKLYVSRLNKIVQEEIELLDKANKELFDKYAIGEGDNKKLDESGIELFNKESEELMKSEVEIQVNTLWSTDLSANDLASIETEEYYPIFYSLVDNKD